MRRQEEKTQCRYKENTGQREPEPLALATGCEVAGGKLKLYKCVQPYENDKVEYSAVVNYSNNY